MSSRCRGGCVGSSPERCLFDTQRALYVWEFPPYPQFYIPREDVDESLLVDEGRTQQTRRGKAQVYGLAGSGDHATGVRAAVLGVRDRRHRRHTSVSSGTRSTAWFEEDEEIFVHPRSPFARSRCAAVDARRVRVELDGVVLAETSSPVILFETGLPPRYYINRTDVRWEHLTPTDNVTQCPYKGTTSDYWSVEVGGTTLSGPRLGL